MKRFPLTIALAASVAITACSTPEEQAAARQRELAREARENLAERRAEERERAEEIAEARRDAAEDVAEARERAAREGARYRAYEEEYARQLGKKPSQLTPAERQWVRDNF